MDNNLTLIDPEFYNSAIGDTSSTLMDTEKYICRPLSFMNNGDFYMDIVYIELLLDPPKIFECSMTTDLQITTLRLKVKYDRDLAFLLENDIAFHTTLNSIGEKTDFYYFKDFEIHEYYIYITVTKEEFGSVYQNVKRI